MYQDPDPPADVDNLIWQIMLRNDSINEIDRIIAINGLLSDQYLEKLNDFDFQDIAKRFEIGTRAYNDEVIREFHKDDWRLLPKISGNIKNETGQS